MKINVKLRKVERETKHLFTTVRFQVSLRRLERVLRCYSVWETMKVTARDSMARVRGAMAPVVSCGVLIKRFFCYPWGMHICVYEEEKQHKTDLDWFYDVACLWHKRAFFIYLTLPVKLTERHNSLRQLLWPLFYPPNHDTQQKTDHNTRNYEPYS